MWSRACPCTLGQTPFFRCLFPACEMGPGVPTVGLGPAVGRGGNSVTTPTPLSPARHHLCHSRHYCRNVGDRVETLYAQLERLVQQASRQADSSVCLYYFNASLYLLRVLKGNTVGKSTCKAQKKEKAATDTGTQPQGPEVSRRWAGKAQPGKSKPVGASPRRRRDHLPISQMGS